MTKEESKNILDLNHAEARDFFLKHESYFNADLPPYFQFSDLLKSVDGVLGEKELKGMVCKGGARDCENVNHSIIANKDGKLSWRPFQMIHPVLYVNLAREITKEKNWNRLNTIFQTMHENPNIKCLSMPVVAKDDLKDRAQQVSKWWQEVELKSVEYALDFDFLYETDISDCYGSFYTHSIAWAIEGKESSKKKENRNKSTLGNFVDSAIQDMQHGQTNGIPQGSVLMDFIAELILGYVDIALTQRLEDNHPSDYKILRYRDDYRVFVNSSEMGEKILKLLSEELADLGLRLNSGKTKYSDDVISSSIKADKKAWMTGSRYNKNLFKHCLIIKQHADKYPNTGSISAALTKLYERVKKLKALDISSRAVISCIVDIAYKNPRVYPVCFAILSKYISMLNGEDQKLLIKKIQSKFTRLPNVGYMEVWFQRATKQHLDDIELNEPLCHLVKGDNVNIWNSDWIKFRELKKVMDDFSIVDREKLLESEPVINSIEFNLFPQISG